MAVVHHFLIREPYQSHVSSPFRVKKGIGYLLLTPRAQNVPGPACTATCQGNSRYRKTSHRRERRSLNQASSAVNTWAPPQGQATSAGADQARICKTPDPQERPRKKAVVQSHSFLSENKVMLWRCVICVEPKTHKQRCGEVRFVIRARSRIVPGWLSAFHTSGLMTPA
jgi:hypothetical protein